MTPTIEAHGLEKRYRQTSALDGLDLVAEPGQVPPCSARTAPARPPSCARWRRCCGPTRGRCAWPATTCVREPEPRPPR